MCVLIVKLPNIELPKKSIMQACCKANRDGFGFVTPTKYYRTLDSGDFINKLYNEVSADEPCLIHCRLATAGSVKTENCHPFVSEDGEWAFAHNGCLNIRTKGDLTDSETYFKTIAPKLAQTGLNSRLCSQIDKARGSSRFAFLNMSTGTIYTFGNFEAINGVLFSNTRWQVWLSERKPKLANWFISQADYTARQDYYSELFN